MTKQPVTWRRVAGVLAFAVLAALATALVLSTRADAQQATSSVSVVPTSVTRTLGQQQTMTATVFPAQSGVRVRMQVLSGPNVDETASALTNGSGQASLSYLGDGGTGTDAILVWVDLDLDGVRDDTEPQTAAIAAWVVSPITGIDLTPSAATVPAGATHSIVATLSPAQPGIHIRFRVASGPNQGDPRIAVSDAAGSALLRYEGSGGVGVDTVLGWADLNKNGLLDAGEPRDTATVTWVTSTSGGLSVTPGSDTNPVGTVHSLTATLSPAQTNAVIRFRISSGPNAGETGIGLTNSAGRASYSYIGDGGPGTDVITVWVDIDGDGVRDTNEASVIATKVWTSSTPGITASPNGGTSLVGTQHTVTATVNPVSSGVVTRFRVTAGPHVGAVARSVTNAAGQTFFNYTGTKTGTDSITIWIDANDNGVLDAAEARTVVTRTWTTSTPAQSIALVPSSNVSLLGTTHTVTATVSPAESGALLRFLVAMGPNAGRSGARITNAQGQASFSYSGTGGIGSDAIVVWIDRNGNGARETSEPQASAVQRWSTAGGASSISVAPQNSTGQVNTQHGVTATIAPASANTLVRFRVTQGPNLGDAGASLTNVSGRASFSYIGNGGVGSDLILAWADLDGDGVVDPNEPQAAAIRSWTQVAGSAFSLAPADDTNPVNTRHSMTATVAPAQSGLLVRFEVTAGPNDGERGSDETNSNGHADLSYVGDGGTGIDVILAWIDFDRDGRIDSGEPQAVATKRWTAPAASGLTLTPANDTNPVNTRHQMSAFVTPAQSGVLVRFEVTDGPNEGEHGSDSTNSSGRADLSYVGDHGPGTDVILAWADLDRDGRVDAGEPQAVATKQWTQQSPSGISLSPQSDDERVGHKQKLTAQITPRLKNRLVRFQVLSGPNAGDSGRDRTNGSGKAMFSYRGDGGPGTDVVRAWVDLDEDGVLDANEPQTTAVVTWSGVDGSVDARVEDVCDHLDRYSNPSLPVLCDLVLNHGLPAGAREAISDAILFRVGVGYWPRANREWPYTSIWWSRVDDMSHSRSVWWRHDNHHDD